MSKKIAILLTLTTWIVTYCKTSNKIHISDNLIEKIAKEDQKIPSQFSNCFFFVKCKENSIALIDVHYLRELYKLSAPKFDYETFLKDILNQNSNIDCQDVSNKFELDSNICNHFNKIGLKEFINYYCTKTGDNRYKLNKGITADQTKTVLYLLFINNYISAQDDYLGVYLVKEML